MVTAVAVWNHRPTADELLEARVVRGLGADAHGDAGWTNDSWARGVARLQIARYQSLTLGHLSGKRLIARFVLAERANSR